MIAEKIARIFQVYAPSLYITDDENVAIFPDASGHFHTYDLKPRGHYEVHGDDVTLPVAESSQGQPDHRFRFLRGQAPSAAAGAPPASIPSASKVKTYQRSVYIAEVDGGKIRPNRTVIVRFSEFEASTEGILSKVQAAMQSEEPYVLTDAQGNEIIDSEGTRGPLQEPMVSTCCESIVGCKTCIQQCLDASDVCPKCRGNDFTNHVHRLCGLMDALSALADIVKAD
ncbi:hypothetical protein ACEWY4_018236 [Coilia grayii]|uniref:Uncharacterized protein n=1 Tax=Coilia grayii TaxID=363190 RepID=A0ABD1JJD7_9TELE